MVKKIKLDKRWKEIIFAATGFGPNLLMVLMTAYFTDAVIPTGLMADLDFWSYGGVIIVSTIIFPILWTIGRIFDGVVDVPLASWTDNLQNKTGKRFIGLIISVVPMIISYVLCWIPVFGKGEDISTLQQVGNTIWIFFWSILFFATYTLGLITFYGSLSDVCENQTQRARVSAYKSVFDTITYALGYAAIPAIFKGVGLPIWQVAIYMSPLMLTILIPLFMGNKNIGKDEVEHKEKEIPIGTSILLTLKSKPFMKWTAVNCTAFFGLQMFLVAQNSLISGVMGLGAGYAAILNTCAFAPVPLMLFLFNKLRRNKGVRFAYQSALLAFAIGILSLSLAGDYIWHGNLAAKLLIGCVGSVIGSWGIGAFFMVPYLIPTSIAAVEEEVTGKNHSAMYFAVQALFTSVVGAIASSLIYDYLKLWVVPATDTTPELKCGVSFVPFIVVLACVAGFFVCFAMPKKYTAKVIYEDLRNSAAKKYERIEAKRKAILRNKEKRELSIKTSNKTEARKQLLLDKINNGYSVKLAKLDKKAIEPKQVLDLKFDESKSIGNEETDKIEKNSMFGTVALYVLTGGIYNYVTWFTDMANLKTIGKKAKWWEVLLIVHAGFIPGLSAFESLFYSCRLEKYAKEHNVKIKTHKWLCFTTSLVFPCFMNLVELIVRTNCFNKISKSLDK